MPPTLGHQLPGKPITSSTFGLLRPHAQGEPGEAVIRLSEGPVFHLMFQTILSRGEELAIVRKFDRNDQWLRELSRLEAAEKAQARKDAGTSSRPSVMATIRSYVPFL